MKESIDNIKEILINDEIVNTTNESENKDTVLISERKSKLYVSNSSDEQKFSVYQLTLEILTNPKKNYRYKLPLNYFIVNLISIILFSISILVMEVIICIGLLIIFNKFFKNEDLWEQLKFFVKVFFSKWYFIGQLCSHFSIGFFCITTFSNIFIGIKKPIKFFISNIIKAILFYFFTSFIISFIVDSIMKEIIQKNLLEKANEDQYPIIKKITDSFINSTSKKIENFMGKYNIFLDELIIGMLYFFLFYNPTNYNKDKLLIFRLFILVPIIYIIISLIIRGLNINNIIDFSTNIMQIFIGQKFTIYGFFVTTCLLIKLYGKKYNIFNKDGEIDQYVFAGLGGKIFSTFCIFELICGLFIPELNNIGIGNNYLIILGAPIIFIYNYKNNPSCKCLCCKNFKLSYINTIIKIVVYLIIIIIALVIFIICLYLIDKLKPVIEEIITFIIEFSDLIFKFIETYSGYN